MMEFGRAFLTVCKLVDSMGDNWVAELDDKKVVLKEF